jgi:hypothetical protein
MFFHWKAVVICCRGRSYRTTKKYTIREKFRVFGVEPSGMYSNCFVLKAYDREVLIIFQPDDHSAVPWPSYTVVDAATNDAVTNECYNEKFSSIKSGCYNEHRCYNECGGIPSACE